MQQVAQSWLIYRLTHSAFLLGLVGFTSMIPTFFLSPVAGVVIDRLNRRRILFVTQSLFMAQAFVFWYLVVSNRITIGWVLGLSVVFGLLCAFDIPGRQSFLSELIDDKEHLTNAIALHSFMFNGARFVGPALAGILIARGGEGLCFFLNALSYGAILWALLLIRLRRRSARTVEKMPSLWVSLKEGFFQVYRFKPMWNILLLLSLVSFAGMSYTALLPIFAKQMLGGGSETLGFLIASSGIGAFCAAVFLASRKNHEGFLQLMPVATGLFGVCVMAFSFSKSMPLSMILLFFAGFGVMIQMNTSNILLQVAAADNLRGRIMSFYTMAFIGMAPIGALVAGAVATKIGAPVTVLIGGAVCLLGGLLFATKVREMELAVKEVMR